MLNNKQEYSDIGLPDWFFANMELYPKDDGVDCCNSLSIRVCSRSFAVNLFLIG